MTGRRQGIKNHIVDRDEMAKACSEIPDKDLRLALMTLALTYNQNVKINEEIFQKQSREIERLQKEMVFSVREESATTRFVVSGSRCRAAHSALA